MSDIDDFKRSLIAAEKAIDLVSPTAQLAKDILKIEREIMYGGRNVSAHKKKIKDEIEFRADEVLEDESN